MRAGAETGDSIAEAVRELATPLFGSTPRTVASFIPIVLMPGPAGELVGGVGCSVILAIASSYLLVRRLVQGPPAPVAPLSGAPA
jgi:multidrug efflux pump subunit AcrB